MKKKRNFIIIFLWIILFIFILGGGIVIYMWNSLNKITENNSDKIKPEDDIKADAVEADTPVNILLMGADYVEGENTDFSRRRTDTMMVVHFNPKTHDVLVTSLPRDTQVKYKNKKHKLNDINEIGGPALLVPTIEDILSVDINYYILLDYTAFNKIVDDLGGVTLTVPHYMKYDDDTQNLHISFKKGETVTLDGKKAEEFFRWRHNNEDEPIADTVDAGGDLGRIENQRIFMKAAIKKISTPSVVTKIPKLVNTASESIITNMSSSDIIKYGISLSKTNLSSIEFVTMPGESKEDEDGVWWYIQDKDKIKSLTDAINNDKPYLDRGKLSVKLKNSSSTKGMCTSLRDDLIKDKFYDLYFVHFDEDSGTSEVSQSSSIDVYGLDKKYDVLLLDDFKDYGITTIKHHELADEDNSDIVVTIGEDATIPKVNK